MVLFASAVYGQASVQPKALNDVGVVEHLGQKVPMDLTFTNETGKPVKFGDYLNQKKPVVLILAYFNCPMLCNLVLTGVDNGAKGLPFKSGERYDVVAVSIDPKDTASSAAAFKEKYPNLRGHFLVGDQPSIDALAKSVGFQYKYDEKSKEYFHRAVTFVLTPDGRISRYLYGIEYPAFDLKMAILEANQGKLVSTVERVLLFCYNYDPQSQKYVLYAMNLMRAGGFITLIAIGVLIWRLKVAK